jgi:hypothetical protein
LELGLLSELNGIKMELTPTLQESNIIRKDCGVKRMGNNCKSDYHGWFMWVNTFATLLAHNAKGFLQQNLAAVKQIIFLDQNNHNILNR